MVHDSWRRFPGHFFLFFPRVTIRTKKRGATRALQATGEYAPSMLLDRE